MRRIAVGTIFAKNYLAQARTLATSFQKWHPEIPLFGLLADECDGHFTPETEPFHLLKLDQVDLPDLHRLKVQSTRQQLAVLAKPFLIQYLLDRGFQAVLLLDPDVWILNRLDSLLELIRRHSVVLTPHLLEPPSAKHRLSREFNILVSGIYNGGCLGVSDTLTSRQFLGWFQERLLAHCRHAITEGVYYDQRWLDLVPTYFDDVKICCDPGVNIAYWNLPERQLERANGTYSVQGQPAKFFHFSGFEPEDSERLSRYVVSGMKSQDPVIQQL
ncbi:MAG: hypothetical protein KDA84_04755, partial [Planctomycetaceae bacterium]|nr:hypothetical protein [Planctomycetaceae bacterium]